MSILSSLFSIFSTPTCISCGNHAKYDPGEQKNYVALDSTSPENVALICKSCATFFETIDKLRKNQFEEARRERLPRGTDRKPKQRRE